MRKDRGTTLRSLAFAAIGIVSFGCGGPQAESVASGGGESTQDEIMKVRFERSGGFAGMTRTVEVDEDSLSEAERARLAQLVHDANFFTLPERSARSGSGGADRFNYRITVESAQGTHTVEVAEASVPAALQPLIEWLDQNVRGARPDAGSQQ